MVKLEVTNLVSDQFGVARYQDPLLVNGWGLIKQDHKLYVAANHSGYVEVYTKHGVLVNSIQLESVDADPASPTGIVGNDTTGFLVQSAPSQWLACTESGTIVAYNATVDATHAFIVVDNSDDDAIYKGMTRAGNYIYVANFATQTVDTFASDYTPVSFPFLDPTMPADYSPFNIANYNGQLYVMYANKANPDDGDETAGPGKGYVSIFNYDGTFVRRFASQGALNAPWGFTIAPKSFCPFKCKILIGNFGDGNINVYDKHGNFLGKLSTSCYNPIVIDGLWGLLADCKKVYFAAGPNDEENGLFGFISPKH